MIRILHMNLVPMRSSLMNPVKVQHKQAPVKKSSTNKTQNNNHDSSLNTISSNSTDDQSSSLPEFDLYIEDRDERDSS